MPTYATNVPCPHCKKGLIVADTTIAEEKWDGFIGPRASPPRLHIDVVFYCNNSRCCVVFHHPPGQPSLEKKIKERILEKQQRDWEKTRPPYFTAPIITPVAKRQLDRAIRQRRS